MGRWTMRCWGLGKVDDEMLGTGEGVGGESI